MIVQLGLSRFDLSVNSSPKPPARTSTKKFSRKYQVAAKVCDNNVATPPIRPTRVIGGGTSRKLAFRAIDCWAVLSAAETGQNGIVSKIQG